MNEHRRSYQKTISVALIAQLGTFAVALGLVGLAWSGGLLRHSWVWLVVGVLAGLAGFLALVIAGGLLALRRDALEARGLPYAAAKPREWLPGPVMRNIRGVWRRLRRGFSRSETRLDLRPGDLVEIKPLEEVLATLDHRGALDGLPFMPEMAALCGRQVRVLRRVEKLHDWVHKTGLHRIRDTVLLEALRCDGTGHGGCLADCHLRWKEAWLRRVPGPARPASPSSRLSLADLERFAKPVAAPGEERYMCQATELTAETPRLSWGDPRPYVRELLTGNVRLGPFLVGLSIAAFNWVQRRRGGAGFPTYAPLGLKPTPEQVLNLRPGELVRVKTKRDIEATLDVGSRNRGLRFDPEMFRFCGGEYRVLARADRFMVEKTGTLTTAKNACIILEGVTATGEYTAFNPENEAIFWREIWLERTVDGSATGPGPDGAPLILVEGHEPGADDGKRNRAGNFSQVDRQ